jgi:hypothetical protein
MNCKKDQIAWIVVPRHYYGSGLEQLNNHVVKTLELIPGFPEPTWRVTPRQVVTFTAHTVDHSGKRIAAGETMWTDQIPDSFLRPFDPKSQPEPDVVTRELEHAV